MDQPDYQHHSACGMNVSHIPPLHANVDVCRHLRQPPRTETGTCIQSGGGEFSPPNIHFGLCIHHPCLRKIRKLFPGIQFDYSLDFRIPNDLETYDDFENTLFINAADPWSIMGNGHKGDTSLDGFWGRISAVAVLSTPLVNKHIQYIPCKVT